MNNDIVIRKNNPVIFSKKSQNGKLMIDGCAMINQKKLH